MSEQVSTGPHKLKFNRDVELITCDSIDDGEPVYGSEIFDAGEEVEVDLIGYPERFDGTKLVEDTSEWNIQFGDGTVALGVSREWFDII